MSKTWNRVINKLREIVASSHRLAPVLRFEDYAKQYDDSSYHLIETNRETVVISARYFGEEVVPTERYILPDAYWVSLHHGRVIGGSNVVITSDRKLLYDMLASCDLYNANMTDNGLFMLFGKPHHIGNRYFYSYLRKKGKFVEKGISLASNMSNNYYHFMFQVAAKFCYINLVGFDKSIPLLVDEQVLRIPQMRQIVDTLNKDKREIIPLHSRVLYDVGELYSFSDPNVVIPNWKEISHDRSHAFAFDKKALDYLRTTILEEADNHSNVSYPKRIFLSRKDCNRRTINEDELKPILDKYGYEFVYTGEMDVFSQANLFRQAEYIIGSSGAAFTNLLYCSEGCQVLLLVPHHLNTTCFSSLGAPLGLNTLFIAGDGNPTKLHLAHFRVDYNTLEKCMVYMHNRD